MLISGNPICALAAIKTKSEAIAISAPAPRAKPLTAATTGFDNCISRLQTICSPCRYCRRSYAVRPALQGAKPEHAFYVAVGLGPAQCRIQFLIELLGYRIEPLRAIEADFRYPVVRLIEDSCGLHDRRSLQTSTEECYQLMPVPPKRGA